MEPTTHPFDREDVMAYLDGELTAERAAATAVHLEQCAECRALAASLRSLTSQLPQWEVEMIPATVEQNVIRAAKQMAAQAVPVLVPAPAPVRRPIRWLLWGSAVSAAAMLLFVLSIPTLHRSHEAASESVQQATKLSAPAPSTPPAAGPTTAANEYRARSMESKNMAVNRDAVTAGAPAKKTAAQSQISDTRQSEPMIIRHASLAMLTKEFEAARASLENLVKAHQGYFGQLNVGAPANAGRTLAATVRVPAAQLDGVLVELRKLGKVEQENQTADDVTRQYVDLVARLSNARETEKRLVEILRERTGRVSDVLEVEQEIARTRQQIEQMDAERKNLDSEVRYASIDLRITEEYKQSLETPTPSLGTRLNNAAVGGLRDASDLVVGLILWLLGAVPTLLVLALLMAWPVVSLVRWIRRRLATIPVAAH